MNTLNFLYLNNMTCDLVTKLDLHHKLLLNYMLYINRTVFLL